MGSLAHVLTEKAWVDKKKLTYALETREVEYYNAIARRKKGPT
jgi:hypothetical protein